MGYSVSLLNGSIAKLRQREVEAHWIERLENALIENDIEVARRSLRPDNAEDGESNSEEEGQGSGAW